MTKNYSPSWGTPDEIIDLARSVLGEIDLDPFTSPIFNERVRATNAIYGHGGRDGFAEPWYGRMLVNPPGPGANVRRAWAKLMIERARADFGGAIWVSFNLEDLRRLQPQGETSWISPLSSMFGWCRMIPRKRLRFVDGTGAARSAPMNANAIVWVAPREDKPQHREQLERWHAAAPMFGEVF